MWPWQGAIYSHFSLLLFSDHPLKLSSGQIQTEVRMLGSPWWREKGQTIDPENLTENIHERRTCRTAISRSKGSVQLLSCVRLFVTPWTAARLASLSITNSWSLLKLMSIESVMDKPSHPLLSPSPSTFNLSQHQGLSQWVSSYQVAKVLEFQLQHQSLQWTPKNDIL